ncbi:MAG: trigger factor [Holosporaceae bacterium]|jgi:trigger factor|nr:trigger factor [Holosporaceae bacterium]
MKILGKTSDGLKRCYNVLISKEEMDSALTLKLQEIAKKVRLDGFRSGKVPLDIVKRMYGEQASVESKKFAVETAAKKILNDEKLLTSFGYLTDIIKDEGNELEFSLKFELIPSFELKEISDIELRKRVAKITDKEVDETLETIRKGHKKWVECGKTQKVQEGQKAIIDLALKTANKKLKNGEINDLEVVIGDETLVDDFWKHLLGAKLAETREFFITYPSSFEDKTLAGKTMEYKATIKKILNPEEHKFDDEFAKSIGYENLEKAREWARSLCISKYDYMSKDIMRRDLLDKMSYMYDFDVPQNMTDIENKEVSRQIEEEAKKLGKEFTPAIREECRKIAESRVRLGFVIAEIAKKEKITVSKNEISQSIKNIATMYPGHEKEVWDAYTRSDAIQAMVGPILETKVINFLFDKIKIKEEKCSIKELIDLDEETFDFFKEEPKPKSKKSASKTPNTKSSVKKSSVNKEKVE